MANFQEVGGSNPSPATKHAIMILPIKGVYLDGIIEGSKTIEYRDMTDFYISRFCITDANGDFVEWKQIDSITFRAGYSKTSRSATFEIAPIELVELLDEEGNGTDEFLFALHIGNRIS